MMIIYIVKFFTDLIMLNSIETASLMYIKSNTLLPSVLLIFTIFRKISHVGYS